MHCNRMQMLQCDYNTERNHSNGLRLGTMFSEWMHFGEAFLSHPVTLSICKQIIIRWWTRIAVCSCSHPVSSFSLEIIQGVELARKPHAIWDSFVAFLWKDCWNDPMLTPNGLERQHSIRNKAASIPFLCTCLKLNTLFGPNEHIEYRVSI